MSSVPFDAGDAVTTGSRTTAFQNGKGHLRPSLRPRMGFADSPCSRGCTAGPTGLREAPSGSGSVHAEAPPPLANGVSESLVRAPEKPSDGSPPGHHKPEEHTETAPNTTESVRAACALTRWFGAIHLAWQKPLVLLLHVEPTLHHNRPDLRLRGRIPSPSQHGIHCKAQEDPEALRLGINARPRYRPRSTPDAVIVSVLDLQP